MNAVRRLFARFASNGALMIAIVYAVMLIAYAASISSLSINSFNNILNAATPLALAAAGQTLIILIGGFDLSVAGVISISNVILALYPLEGPSGALVSLLIVMGIGLAVGIVNGILVAYLRIQAIAATLGTMIVCQGIALLLLNAPGGWVADWMVYELTGLIGGTLPVATLILLAVACAWLALKRTRFGAGLYAVGEDETAAELSGVNTRRVKFKAFCVAGICYGMAGYMLSAQTSTGDPNAGEPLLLLSFAAVAIGGTAFGGGRGGVIGSIIGALVLTLMQRMLFALGVSSFYTGLFQALVMVIAVVFAAIMLKLAKNRAQAEAG